MAWFILSQLVSMVLEWFRIGRLSEPEKVLEILLLRQQLIILERHLNKPVRPSRIEKLTLAVITAKFKAAQPETALKWHRYLVRGKWKN